jgi:hypothetical protein
MADTSHFTEEPKKKEKKHKGSFLNPVNIGKGAISGVSKFGNMMGIGSDERKEHKKEKKSKKEKEEVSSIKYSYFN